MERRAREGAMSAVLDITAVEMRHVRRRNTGLCRPKCHFVFSFVASRLPLER